MELLVVVIDEEDRLDAILSGFLELGVAGATVIDTQGMIARLPKNGAVVAGLQDLLTKSRPKSSTVFSVIESEKTLEAAIEMVQEKCGDLEDPGTGILFTVPISRAVGLAKAIAPEQS